jgi:hypothetical protein
VLQVKLHDVPLQDDAAFAWVGHSLHDVPHEVVDMLLRQAPAQLWVSVAQT